MPRRIKAPTTPAQNFRITDDGGKLRATCATWDDAVRGPSRQEGGMTREKAVDLVMNAQRGDLPKGCVLVVLPEQGSGGKDSSSQRPRPAARFSRGARRGINPAVAVPVVPVAADCVTPLRPRSA